MELQPKKDSTIDFLCVARQTSERFPNKIFAEIDGRPLISIIIEKLKIVNAGIIFAIPENNQNDKLCNYLIEKSIPVVRGSEDNVLDRFCKASQYSDADFVQRVNCDNLLFDPDYFSQMHDIVRKNSEFSLFTNTQCANHSGQSVEIVRKDLCLSISGPSLYELEHIFPYFYRTIEDQFELPCPTNDVFPIDVPSDLRKLSGVTFK
ncbi:hypothetical protein OAH99_00475 [Planktomarina sp.]|nr:hypothetical protein [Planktomarina sp.]